MRRSVASVAGLLSLVAATFLLTASPSAQSDAAIEASRNHFNANRAEYGLTDPASELRVRRSRADAQGISHVRFDQYYRGLPVFEGEAIAHVDGAGNVTVTNGLQGSLNLDPTPRVNRNAAINTAVRSISPLGNYEVSSASLVILPRGERSIVDRVAWRVAVKVENEFEDPAEWPYFIDAGRGDVAFAFNGLETATADGTANTMYSGTKLAIKVDLQGTTYYLRDVFRANSTSSPYGNTTCDMRNRQANCYFITSTAPNFGDGKISTTGVTAAADAHYGLQQTWDFYKTTFGRNGIDATGKITISRVHYGRSYENAFWSDSCFCMTYGDGATTFYPLVSLDVAGHEMSHGVMSKEANLTYSGESGGLNESNSDIFGTLVEFFSADPLKTVGEARSTDVGDYWIGEKIYKSNYSSGSYKQDKALRYMDDPHKDGASPACWTSSIGSLNVHYSSGPNNHMFYLLAHGGTSMCNGNVVNGIGNDAAGQIWYDAIANRMTASSNYHDARAAALASATALYGPTSAQYNAVAAAFSAINVN